MKLEPVAWALYWGPDDLCDMVTAKRLADDWLARNSNATACKPFVAPLYAIPPGHVVVPVEPTEAMETAGWNVFAGCGRLAMAYKAMITVVQGEQ